MYQNSIGKELSFLLRIWSIVYQTLRNKSLIQLLSKFFPDFRRLNHVLHRVIGYVSFVHVHFNHSGKPDPLPIKRNLLFDRLAKRDTNVTTLQQNDSFSPMMSPLIKIHNIFNLIFRGKAHALKIRIIHS